MRGLVRAWLAASTLSGVPSTVHALVTGGDALAATRAAGALLGRPSVPRGVAAHVGVSAFWTVVLAGVDARRPLGVTGGAVAGLAIAALDPGVVRVPAVRALPAVPQWLDHVAFGALVGWSPGVSRRRGSTVDRGRQP
ncbi:hypothetical protein GCM10010492_06670 [Saccharothrix mutabilis subsp. mutabilis]|uniref:Uncharacterized protein n=1 Tax=Saccharothrix mutabilis subsp. mutabilis TaxID=66855 RepID=A0ABN0T3M5_9PSEU